MARERAHRHRVDAVDALTVYLVLLLAIPATLVFRPLGEAGRPSRIYGLLLLAWWLLDFISRPRSGRTHRIPAVRLGFVLFVLAMAVSYFMATVRPISAVELSAADRSLLAVLSWAGVFLIAADGITTGERLHVLLERISLGVGLFAALGVLQFISGTSFLVPLNFPGMTYLSDELGLVARAGYFRPAATATHPIEYGAVLGLGLAISLFLAVDFDSRRFVRRWFAPAAIAIGIPVSGISVGIH